MMKINFLLIGTSLSLIPTLTNAQCVATIDCATLGYTETSCPDGKGLKCPFGNTFACPASEESVCNKYGFKYDCSGNASGIGQACNNKYASCSCASGYEWKNGKCEAIVLGTCTGKAKNCKVGQILNADGSCSDYRVDGVEPVGVVVYIGGDNCGQAWALESLGAIAWSTEYVDIPNLANYSSKPINDFNSCKNTQTALNYSTKEYGESASKYYPAFWKAYNYAPNSAPSTKGKWCLPAGGILESIYKNRVAIDRSLTRISKENIGNKDLWSSSEIARDFAWRWEADSDDFGLYQTNYKNNGYVVRPVIEF
ncbi:MAG: hypothetical protein Q4F75_05390 [Pseudomonadota bacterium]|nr:hypothetical protein [Pseudomonadota bacterium]